MYGDIPQPLFIGEKFNIDNWNGGDAIIRQFASHLKGEGRYVTEFEWEYISGDFISNYNWLNDQNYINVILRVYDERINEWVFIPYLITYYKSRGRTDAIYKYGKLITLDEYVDLLNIIDATGYKFNLDI